MRQPNPPNFLNRQVLNFRFGRTSGRSGRGHDRRVGHDRGRGLDRDPSGDRVRRGRALPPSNPQSTVRRRGAVEPSVPPHTVVESSSLHATCSAFLLDTNSPPPTRIQEWALRVQPGPPGAAVAPQSRFQRKPARQFSKPRRTAS